MRNVTLHVFVGRLIFFRHEEHPVTVCRACGLTYWKKVMGRHLLQTWWSPRAAVFGFIAIFVNLYHGAQLALLPEPREIPYDRVGD